MTASTLFFCGRPMHSAGRSTADNMLHSFSSSSPQKLKGGGLIRCNDATSNVILTKQYREETVLIMNNHVNPVEKSFFDRINPRQGGGTGMILHDETQSTLFVRCCLMMSPSCLQLYHFSPRHVKILPPFSQPRRCWASLTRYSRDFGSGIG